ncbi:P-loop containing nucleoside triphosphate hydrolase protein [Ascodesmis nigricans]|uniref:RNA helicase n=1 Tax=Ascodesmis nigricans TaxID=341454 RepID=A0A4S2N4E0_9PEZI|nr:P-loop containing nucleoside triphosphate hydrolase protein [Ascodesmis nigricans]
MPRFHPRSRSPRPDYKRRRDDGDYYDARSRHRSRSRDRRDYRDREYDRDRDRDSHRRRDSPRRRDDRYDARYDRHDRRGSREPDRRRSRSRGSTHDRSRRDDRDRRRDDRGRDSPAPVVETEEDKKRIRLERLEAWKKKKAEEEAKLSAAATPASVLSALERQQVKTGPASPVSSVSTPVPELRKKAQTPQSTASASLSKTAPRPKADQGSSVPTSVRLGPTNGSALPTNRPVSTFGFGAAKKSIESKGKRALDFGEEESSRKKLERLPSPVPGDTNGADAVQEDVDEDTEMQDATEEEEAAAARAAAAQRIERAQQEDLKMESEATAPADAGAPMDIDKKEEEEEEIDPLDAFMAGVNTSVAEVEQKDSNRSDKQELLGDDDIDLVATEQDPDDILALASKLKKKKEIPTVNHSKVKYEPFRKSFYVEPFELQNLNETEVKELREELDGIRIRGQDCPKPVQKWSQCGLPSQSLNVIQQLGYEKPSSIQAQAIPAIMSGRDVIGVAKTGSGKTIAFLLPMFRHIKDQRPLEHLEGPVSVIMTPTRELAVQIFKDCKPFLKALNLRAVCAYGGSPIKDQIADLKRGAEIIVCTPGRMIDLLAANGGRVTNLKRVTYVVLDEADRMFDMGLEPQVMKIIGNIRPDRQTVLFSATFPKAMDALARKVLTRPVEITVGGRSVVAPEITQIVEVRPESEKFVRLLELLGNLHEHDEDARTLVFVNRQETADTILRDLMRRGYPCMSIHGGKDQTDRDSTIADFKAGVVPVLIATSVAARGLDVKQLKLVVNYDCPNHMEDYVHRAGRTGRAGNTGTAVTFITEEQERYAADIARALKWSHQPIPEDLQKLVDSFQAKVTAGTERKNLSGFGGKGLERLDQERDMAKRRERKLYGEEGGEEDEIEEDVLKPAGTPTTAGPTVDDAIVVHKRAAPAPSDATQSALDRVKAAASAVTSRLNKTGELRSGVPIDNKGPDAGAYHATLEINDFPQKARWAVTNRTNIAKVLEATGTSITTKGSFYPPGKSPQPGQDPKLYILVEGDTELVVTNAMRELKRLLAEGTAAAVDSESRAPLSGAKYSVM